MCQVLALLKETRGASFPRCAISNPDSGPPLLKIGTVVKAILKHLRLPTTGPPIAPARSTAPPDLAPWQDDVPALQQALR